MKAEFIKPVSTRMCFFCGLLSRVRITEGPYVVLPANSSRLTTEDRPLHLCWTHACSLGMSLQDLGIPASKPSHEVRPLREATGPEPPVQHLPQRPSDDPPVR